MTEHAVENEDGPAYARDPTFCLRTYSPPRSPLPRPRRLRVPDICASAAFKDDVDIGDPSVSDWTAIPTENIRGTRPWLRKYIKEMEMAASREWGVVLPCMDAYRNINGDGSPDVLEPSYPDMCDGIDTSPRVGGRAPESGLTRGELVFPLPRNIRQQYDNDKMALPKNDIVFKPQHGGNYRTFLEPGIPNNSFGYPWWSNDTTHLDHRTKYGNVEHRADVPRKNNAPLQHNVVQSGYGLECIRQRRRPLPQTLYRGWRD